MEERAYLGDVEVARQETPVDVSTVPNIRVVAVGGSKLKDLLHETLIVTRLLEEQLHNGRKDL